MITAEQTLTDRFRAVQAAGKLLVQLSPSKVNNVLKAVAERAIAQTDELLAENKKDLDRMPETDPKFDRLKLTPTRILDIAKEMHNVAAFPSPLGKLLEEKTMENGLKITKITVPLGVIGIIYEARPNVSFDVFSLCFKAGNACILKGGSDAEYSNKAIVKLIRSVLHEQGIPENCVELLPPTRDAATALLNARDYVDVIIPRGSQQLIDYVRSTSRVPVIETGAGIVHAYFDVTGDLEKGSSIIFNSKTRRVSVCNALDCLLVHRDRLNDLGELVAGLATKNVIVYADEAARQALAGKYPDKLLEEADESHFGTEFLDYKLAIKTVEDAHAAIAHISEHSSRHSETVIAESEQVQEDFTRQVDAAVVYSNVSTAFTDGAQFGLGAEIGISTQKLHARGPMGLNELCSYKWIVRGNGQVRE
jgi:glutamate-5-semialdehyde dehydrogenase